MEKLTKPQLKQWMEDTDLLDIDENVFNSVFVLWELNYTPKTAEDNDSYIDWVYRRSINNERNKCTITNFCC